MKSLLAHYLPILLAFTGSAGLHLAIFFWPFGAIRMHDPPPPAKGRSSIAVRMATRAPTPHRPPEVWSMVDPVNDSAPPSGALPSPTSTELPKSLTNAIIHSRSADRKQPAEAPSSGLPTPTRQSAATPPAIQRESAPAVRRIKRSPPTVSTSAAAAAARENQGALSPPAVIANPFPRYPSDLQRRGIEGKTTLTFTIGVDGRARQIRVRRSSGYPAMDQEGVRALKTWKFRPAKRQGKAVAFPAQHTFRWKIEASSGPTR